MTVHIDKGGYSNSSRLKIWTFSLHLGAFWPYFVWNTNFNYCRFYIYAQWWLLSIITNFKFCMTFFMLSWFNLKYFWELVKIAIIAAFCKITCKIWFLMHSMNPAISFLVFSCIEERKKNLFLILFLRFYKNTKTIFTAKVWESET